MRIGLFDPGLEDDRGTPSSNLGDLIIQEAVDRELHEIFGRAPDVRITTQSRPTRSLLRDLRQCDWLFVGGTNLLSSQVRTYRQWAIGPLDAVQIRRAVLFGVGWWQYQDDPDLASRLLWKAALSSRLKHSVRDAYTVRKLHRMGLRNVLNTGCPTMWPLARRDFRNLPRRSADAVLLMLTDYMPDPVADTALGRLLTKRYGEVLFWPQGRADLDYVRHLGLPLTLLDHSLPALDALLRSNRIFDYIGTRLHGGVRCLLANRRSLILAVDNRATEIARDTGLQVVPRESLAAIEEWIPSSQPPSIRLDTAAIEEWRSQFNPVASCSTAP